MKKSLNYCRVLFIAFLESRYVFLELLLLMAREGGRKKFMFTAHLKEGKLNPNQPFNLCARGGVCFLKSMASFYSAVGPKPVKHFLAANWRKPCPLIL